MKRNWETKLQCDEYFDWVEVTCETNGFEEQKFSTTVDHELKCWRFASNQ